MLFNINVCTPPSVLEFNRDQAVLVFIGDCSNMQYIESVGGVPASLYNPPFEAITAQLDGNYQAFQEMYFKYLMENPDVQEFTVALIRTVLMGKPVILFLEQSEFDLYYQTLDTFFRSCFGLCVGNIMVGRQGAIDDNMCQNIISYLYLTGDMPFEIFMRLYYGQYTEDIINKMIIDNNMQYVTKLNCSVEQYNQIFNNIRDNINSHGAVKRSPLIRNYNHDSVQ